MREIKFRVWDKKNNIYYPKIWGLGWKIGGIRFFWDDYKDSDGETMVTDLVDGDYELMQYTGLKDKNGKEIYEGDIIKSDFFKRQEVYWEDLDGAWKVRYMNGTAKCKDLICLFQSREVIGNIYETPELLAPAKQPETTSGNGLEKIILEG